MVRVEGLEPPRLAAPEPKSGASTNFATPARPYTTFKDLLTKEDQSCETQNDLFIFFEPECYLENSVKFYFTG